MTNADFERARLCLLLTRSLCRGDPLDVLEAALTGGADLVQVREKPFGNDALVWIESVIDVCEAYEVAVVVNDRPDLALATSAAGVHLGQEDLASYWPGGLKTRKFQLGISTHDTRELDRALLEDPDYVGVGNCFPTATKGWDTATPDDVLGELCARSPVPAFAIGGITIENCPSVLELGFRRVAVSRTVLAADDPERACRGLRRLLEAAAG